MAELASPGAQCHVTLAIRKGQSAGRGAEPDQTGGQEGAPVMAAGLCVAGPEGGGLIRP